MPFQENTRRAQRDALAFLIIVLPSNFMGRRAWEMLKQIIEGGRI
jgi:hypothetical protein